MFLNQLILLCIYILGIILLRTDKTHRSNNLLEAYFCLFLSLSSQYEIKVIFIFTSLKEIRLVI